MIASVAGPTSIYLNAAAIASDPVERMKNIVVASFAFLYSCHTWDKPLNPVLGETYQASLPDGTKIFLEQVCHKPPISYVLFEGPPHAPYQWSGYTSLSVKAYFNSINLTVGGHKIIKFSDGSDIIYNN